jgi:hypothetical protein
MSIAKKIEMERHRRDINLFGPASQPGATGDSGVDPGPTEVVLSGCFKQRY